MNQLIQVLKKNPVFKFFASVRLAVPLMLALGVIVAIGTIYESRYNAQIAGLAIYKTTWFQALLGLLWINIFCAMIPRIPFKIHHTGFVITHIGLLILLIGAFVTWKTGIDGQLRVVEGQNNHQVALPDLAIKVVNSQTDTLYDVKFPRKLKPREGSALGMGRLSADTGIVVEKYLPFASKEQSYVSQPGSGGGTAVDFRLQSPFFNVTEALHSQDRPEMQLGPAKIRLVNESTPRVVPIRGAKRGKASANRNSGKSGVLVIKDAKSNAELARLPVSRLLKKSETIRNVKISVAEVFEEGVVSGGKLVDRGNKDANPALELKVEQDGKTIREVAFAKYPTFSLAQNGTFGIRFEYLPASPPMPAPEAAPVVASANPVSLDRSGNVIEFHLRGEQVRLELYKDGKRVLERQVNAGEVVETPWMGMKISLNRIVPESVSKEVVAPVNLVPKAPTPPSAIFVRTEGGSAEDGVWLMEGEYKTLQSPKGGAYEVYYGMDSVDLPFSIFLEKFSKLDYPGTETPMSYQSNVRVNGAGESILISMNEPLKRDGFTFYQSSYEMGQGMETASIFSVNRDPGRPIKYAGSLILCVGIVVFTVMRSRWYNNRKQGKRMKTQMAMVMLGLSGLLSTAIGPELRAEEPHNHQATQQQADMTPDVALQRFKEYASRIESAQIAELPLQSNGRLKPFDSLARETVLYLSGKYSQWGLNAVQIYLGLMISEATPYLEVINIRTPELRAKLGFSKNQRLFSLHELSGTKLEEIAKPILAKQQQNEKSVEPDEKNVVEVVQQLWLMRAIMSGNQLFQALNYNGSPRADQPAMGTGEVMQGAQKYLKAVAMGDRTLAAQEARGFVQAAKNQPMPELFRRNVGKMGLEVWYNKAHLFFWTAMAYLLIGLAMVVPVLRKYLTKRTTLIALALPFLIHIAGFAIRVYITGFAPVTNMYGTMIWMGLGVVLFGGILFALYSNYAVYGYLLIGGGLTLLLTESIPLTLSPDMDPIVAVLRNNFWLTIHVLTITISYAAFTVAMLIGNVSLIKSIISGLGGPKVDSKFYSEYSHLAYRVIQLGVFLLTAGIILGGVWADYSWGRFWGWDPKETWALIADLGFLAILHAKYLGWLGGFGLLAAAPVAYLLVIMAWYGVNFILAAGLHSYGFSSGGATMVVSFVTFQLILFGVALVVRKMKPTQALKA